MILYFVSDVNILMKPLLKEHCSRNWRNYAWEIQSPQFFLGSSESVYLNKRLIGVLVTKAKASRNPILSTIVSG